jgi:translation initiation factor IF-3
MTAEQRKALQVTAAWLKVIADRFELDRRFEATIRHEGEVIGTYSISQALDMANEALEPAS